MAGKLTFHVDDELMTIIDHCKKNKCRIPYTNKISKVPGMWLVKDSGVYLMASTGGLKASTPAPKDKHGMERNLVVYAVGHDPNKNKDTWGYDREICGGDDFAEFVPLGQLADKAQKGMQIVIDITPTDMGIELFGKPQPAPKPQSAQKPKAKRKKEPTLC